jgi:hypothetical protein
VKWSVDGHRKHPVSWLDATVVREEDNLRRLAMEGCSPVCARDERAEHRQGKTGAFDRLNSKLDAHAKKFGLDEMTCVWSEAVDGMVDGAPTEIKWQYADNARRLESHPVPHQ